MATDNSKDVLFSFVNTGKARPKRKPKAPKPVLVHVIRKALASGATPVGIARAIQHAFKVVPK